jgi:NhaP-type Na+/H+ or K+/H+ antiporter
MIVGGGVGAIVTFILTSLFPTDPAVGFGATFAYFALFGVAAGVTIGAVVAIILDRVSVRRARSVSVEVTTETDDQ